MSESRRSNALDPKVLESWKSLDPENWRRVALNVIATFLRSAPSFMDRLRDAGQEARFEPAVQAARSLRASFQLVGALAAAELCERVEEAAEAESANALAEAARDVEAAYEEAMQALAVYEASL